MLIGYARVSTQEQDTQAQISALKSAGCELIFQEKVSGGRWDRPELQRLLQQLRKDDQVIVWKLDRLSRSLKDLLLTLEKIENTGADFRSITENIDTSTKKNTFFISNPFIFIIIGMKGAFDEGPCTSLRRFKSGLTVSSPPFFNCFNDTFRTIILTWFWVIDEIRTIRMLC